MDARTMRLHDLRLFFFAMDMNVLLWLQAPPSVATEAHTGSPAFLPSLCAAWL